MTFFNLIQRAKCFNLRLRGRNKSQKLGEKPKKPPETCHFRASFHHTFRSPWFHTAGTWALALRWPIG
jgi:hypothetical protein